MSSGDEIDVYSAQGYQGDVQVTLEIDPMAHGPISDELHERAWDFLLEH